MSPTGKQTAIMFQSAPRLWAAENTVIDSVLKAVQLVSIRSAALGRGEPRASAAELRAKGVSIRSAALGRGELPCSNS